MQKKYKLTKETKTVGFRTLFRIEALISFGNDEVKELTMDEIANKFGISVENLKIKK